VKDRSGNVAEVHSVLPKLGLRPERPVTVPLTVEREGPGCSTAGGAAWAVAFGVLAALRRRRGGR